ncbi:hypothetical protein EVAR_45577_1 [Eumeta japonica]|uniref:Uncharacterized protein n=1 Tax=Eumeta variegata TaxID=151549 RepID=A0A4C1YRD3_EUMVA|nr:hypothetical protein EVAR_45577_1 [Eumeta japonica]
MTRASKYVQFEEKVKAESTRGKKKTDPVPSSNSVNSSNVDCDRSRSDMFSPSSVKKLMEAKVEDALIKERKANEEDNISISGSDNNGKDGDHFYSTVIQSEENRHIKLMTLVNPLLSFIYCDGGGELETVRESGRTSASADDIRICLIFLTHGSHVPR